MLTREQIGEWRESVKAAGTFGGSQLAESWRVKFNALCDLALRGLEHDALLKRCEEAERGRDQWGRMYAECNKREVELLGRLAAAPSKCSNPDCKDGVVLKKHGGGYECPACYQDKEKP